MTTALEDELLMHKVNYIHIKFKYYKVNITKASETMFLANLVPRVFKPLVYSCVFRNLLGRNPAMS